MNPPRLDPDALFVALALVPTSFSRNKFYSLYSDVALFQARRRAQLVRQIVRELLESPTPQGGGVEILEEVESEEGMKLVYQKSEFDYRRTALLSPIEAAVLRYSLGRAGVRPVVPAAEAQVRQVLGRLEQSLEIRPESG